MQLALDPTAIQLANGESANGYSAVVDPHYKDYKCDQDTSPLNQIYILL